MPPPPFCEGLIYKIRIYKIKIYKIRIYEIRIYKIGIYKIRIYKIRIYEIRIYKIWVYKIRIYKIRIYEMRIYEMRIYETKYASLLLSAPFETILVSNDWWTHLDKSFGPNLFTNELPSAHFKMLLKLALH